MPRVTVGERLNVLRNLLRRGTLLLRRGRQGRRPRHGLRHVFALLELYKRGEAAWEQDEPFGPITVRAETAARPAAEVAAA